MMGKIGFLVGIVLALAILIDPAQGKQNTSSRSLIRGPITVGTGTETYSVKNYGAIGDGIVDDTAAINATSVQVNASRK
jgi:hypothetical protein